MPPKPLDDWYRAAMRASWRGLVEVHPTYPHGDLVGGVTVFNIAGNKYRLIVRIHYASQAIYIRRVLTHAEYDKRDWKE